MNLPRFNLPPAFKQRRTWFRALAGAAVLGLCMGFTNFHFKHHDEYVVRDLVSDGAVPAEHVDKNLMNPWGLALSPTSPVWVADNGTNLSTIYDGNGVAQSLVVNLPTGINGAANPTGTVFNATTDFVVSANGKSGTAAFIFDGEGGTLMGWSPAVDTTNAVVAYDDGTGGAVYKALALQSSGGQNFLYATDFHNAKVDVFDTHFAKVATRGGFTDPNLPAGFAPFGIAALHHALYVSYAQQKAPDNHDNNNGAGLGYIDVYTPDGFLIHRLVSGGPLNAPWGMVQAPRHFGGFSRMLLVGNFGDGMINAFNPVTGEFKGSLSTSSGPFAEPGLWGLAFGNGTADRPSNTLFFAAGINDEADGLFGRIDVPPREHDQDNDHGGDHGNDQGNDNSQGDE